jgi:hypothetical protein
MGILDWVKSRGKEPLGETAPTQHVTNDRNSIKQIWKSEWQPDGQGLYEFRHHVGQSTHGFHGGLEVSGGRGESPFQWGQARATPQEAKNASYGMSEGWNLADRTWRGAQYDIPEVDFSKHVGFEKGPPNSAPTKSLGKRQRPEPENEPKPSPYFTQKGNEITIQSSSDWISDGVGAYELRTHVGKSIEGYHGGLAVSPQGGESSWRWSNARPTPQAAGNAAYGMLDRWQREMSPELERIERLQQENSEFRSERKTLARESSQSWDR